MVLTGNIRAASLVVLLFTAGCAGTAPQGQGGAFEFGVVGDAPYTKKQEKEFPQVIADMNRSDLAFVVHVGDFQADPREYYRQPKNISPPCSDETFKSAMDFFQTSRHPFVVTPGDNDWTDCHFIKERKVDPLERLERVRAMFYPEGRSLGQRTMAVTSQSQDRAYAKFRENLKWTHNGVTFVAHGILDPENELAPPASRLLYVPHRVRAAGRAQSAELATCSAPRHTDDPTPMC
jgi:hypothetical protein